MKIILIIICLLVVVQDIVIGAPTDKNIQSTSSYRDYLDAALVFKDSSEYFKAKAILEKAIQFHPTEEAAYYLGKLEFLSGNEDLFCCSTNSKTAPSQQAREQKILPKKNGSIRRAAIN